MLFNSFSKSFGFNIYFLFSTKCIIFVVGIRTFEYEQNVDIARNATCMRIGVVGMHSKDAREERSTQGGVE